MKLSEQQLHAVTRLLQTEDFRHLLEGLSVYGEALNKALIVNKVETSGDLFELRGQAKALVSILDAITKAPALLQKIETHKEQR